MSDAQRLHLPRYHRFGTPDIAPPQRFEYWRSWYSDAVEATMRLDPPDRRPPATFDCSAEVMELGDVSLIEVHNAPAVASWSAEATEIPDLVRAQLFLRLDQFTLHWHGVDLVPAAGSLLIVGRTAGRWRAPYGLRAIQVNVPRALLPVDGAVIDRVTARQVPPDLVAAGAMVGSMLTGVAGRLRELATLPAAEQAAAWLAAVTMVIRALDGTALDGSDLAPVRRLQAERFIAAHLSDPRLGPDMIAAALHMSRRSLYQLLSTSGEGIATAIRRQRLDRARRILRDPTQRHRPIADIALAVGLPNASHFSRLYRAEYGERPTDTRRS